MRDLNDIYFKELYTKESKIDGIGLFTNQEIKKGDLIFSFGGYLGSESERYKYIRSTAIFINEYIILGERKELDKAITDYINHSCEPNCGMADSIHVIAIRNIAKDEELTIDYTFFENRSNWKLNKKCNCGSKKCRKLISIDYLKTLNSKNEYFNYYSPFNRNKIYRGETK